MWQRDALDWHKHDRVDTTDEDEDSFVAAFNDRQLPSSTTVMMCRAFVWSFSHSCRVSIVHQCSFSHVCWGVALNERKWCAVGFRTEQTMSREPAMSIIIEHEVLFPSTSKRRKYTRIYLRVSKQNRGKWKLRNLRESTWSIFFWFLPSVVSEQENQRENGA